MAPICALREFYKPRGNRTVRPRVRSDAAVQPLLFLSLRRIACFGPTLGPSGSATGRERLLTKEKIYHGGIRSSYDKYDWREQRIFSASIDRLPQCEGPRGNTHLSVWPLHSTPLLVSSPSPLLGCLHGRLFIYPSSAPSVSTSPRWAITEYGRGGPDLTRNSAGPLRFLTAHN